MSRNVKMGRVSLPMDVNSKDAVPAFENMLQKGPMAVVLVYADWCGHCDRYKKNVWTPLKSLKNRTVNMASVREDVLPNTSLKNAKIDGYPSILVVGQDKVPAVFPSTSGVTNAMPESSDVSTMKSIVTAPVPKTATAAVNSTPVNTGVNISYPSLMGSESNTANTNYSLMASEPMPAYNNAYSTNNNMNNTTNYATTQESTVTNLQPPMIEEDEVVPPPEAETPTTSTANTQGTTPILRGGRLYRKLSKKGRKVRKVTRKSKKSSKRKN